MPILILAALCAGCSEERSSASSTEPAFGTGQGASAFDLPPVSEPPAPVETRSYDEGYREGLATGAAQAKAQMESNRRKRPPVPDEVQGAVVALEAAGADVKRGPKWQRGYASGYIDGFARVVEGRK